ncbi:MAG: MvdC/MvdD family ATP grasp protein [Candidatus Thorarchaeota archaeon]
MATRGIILTEETPEVLVVTQRFDAHVDYLAEQFQKKGVSWIRFEMADFPLRTSFSIELDKGTRSVTMWLGDQVLDLTSVRSVWYRRTETFDLPIEMDPKQRKLARSECRRLIGNVWSVLQDRLWVSKPSAIRNAGHKAEQLIRAAEYGFHVPPTLFSNNPDDVKKFYYSHGGSGNIVYKPHDVIMMPKKDTPEVGVVYTSVLEDKHLERVNEIIPAPGIFQPYVEKDFEARVTVIGDEVFTCAIHSQEVSSTRIDWRAWDWIEGTKSMPPHEPYEMPPHLRDVCLRFVQSYDLKFAAMDFIVTPNGEWVFLEMNPNGQWVWVEEMTGMPMSECFVDLLIDEKHK